MADVPMAEATLQVFRGDREGGNAVEYKYRLFRGWSC
jgi:succinate dehydrogenase / fumarate reductase, iron-sulfur subunit